MYITSIKQMVKVGTVFGNGFTTYKVVKINHENKEMWLSEAISDTTEYAFAYQWRHDWEFRGYTLISQHEPIKLEDLI